MIPKFTNGLIRPRQHKDHNQDESDIWHDFQVWYTSLLGERLAKREQEILDQVLPNLFGYYLLQCGCPQIHKHLDRNWLQSSRISTKYLLDYYKNQGVSFSSSFTQLPIQSDSLDAVLLPHVLEFSFEPHQVLREVERVLIAEGHVVILGFNPWSLWSIFRFVKFGKKQAPWNGRFLSASRVIDWLVLLGFDVVQCEGYYYQLPIQNEKINKKMQFLEKFGRRFWSKLGASYVLVARKRVVTLTPIKPKWRARRKSGATGLEVDIINRNKM